MEREDRRSPLSLFLLAYPVMVTPMLSSGYRHDLQHLDWGEAFERMHEELAAEYPFTEWKSIDWAGQYARYRPLITVSQAEGDMGGFHLTLRRYVYDISDGHMRVTDPDDALREQHVGGGFGLALGQLDDGKVIVTQVWEAAARAGVNWGDEVTHWNGTPVGEALARTPTIWAERPPATREVRRLQELHFLTRAPVGSVAHVTIRPSANGASARLDDSAVGSAGDGPPEGTAESARGSTTRTVRLVAQQDDEATLTFTERHPQPPATSQTFESAMLPGGHGYVRLTAQRFPSDTGEQVRRAVRGFQAAGVRGIVVDLRGNRGGSDFTVSRVVAPFFSVPDLYHHVSLHDPKTERTEVEILPGVADI